MIDRKRDDLDQAIARHKKLLIGIHGAMERNSGSLARRLVDLKGSGATVEKLYGELVFLSDVAGMKPPARPFERQ
jgi:hypothetical protein